ncbi:glycosyltransferase family 2 protein [Pontibacter sp. KCTC 32443]|uniref:glycosyltransferase family 2 protein n=1 Tax=Pontibacter TaxID=323449 RepID=UPI00164E19F7|nr:MULTISPECIES: glycosyltransferase family 2 protein [Pontibacter]MBC5774892.1 glycosyltransferase family 2 protein [Pontibacter sp. KCTC 32443]
MQYSITASIVTYNNNPEVLQEAIASFLDTELPVQLYLVDNSPTDALRALCTDARIIYIFNNKNVGFGAGHNIAMREALDKAPYHLVLNPDVYFEPGTLERLYEFMTQHTAVGLVMPKVLYPDGEVQYLCKLLPTPLQFIERRFMKWNRKRLEQQNEMFELRFTGYNKLMDVPYLSGCFMFLRTSALKEVGLFDERIFMYSEDADLSRRIHQKFRTVFYPEARIYHHFAKGSHRSIKLLWYAIHGNLVYFTKWGWLFDRERDRINKNVLSKLTACTNSHP